MKISVIITSFNEAKFLSRAIDSFLEQDYLDKELLIIDDISTDESHKIIVNYCQKFPGVVRWIKEKDYGVSHARNLALKHVDGDLIGFLSAHDFLHKNFFEEMIYYAKKNPNFDVIYFNSYTVGDETNFLPSSFKKVTLENLIEYAPIGSGSSFYYRKKLFDEFKFNEKNRYSMDYEFNLAIVARSNYVFYPVNIAAVFNVDLKENNSHSSELKKSLEIIAVQFKYAKSLLEKLKIFWRTKKLIIKNRNAFNQISGSI
jgi:glycosyltransferase involved in cell wall biosynthesis